MSDVSVVARTSFEVSTLGVFQTLWDALGGGEASSGSSEAGLHTPRRDADFLDLPTLQVSVGGMEEDAGQLGSFSVGASVLPSDCAAVNATMLESPRGVRPKAREAGVP